MVTSLRCDNCGRPHEVENIRVIGRRKSLWLLSVFCPVCESRYLVVAAPGKEDAQAVSDLTAAERRRFRKKSVTSDDVLSMHSYLKGFKGDLSSLLKG